MTILATLAGVDINLANVSLDIILLGVNLEVLNSNVELGRAIVDGVDLLAVVVVDKLLLGDGVGSLQGVALAVVVVDVQLGGLFDLVDDLEGNVLVLAGRHGHGLEAVLVLAGAGGAVAWGEGDFEFAPGGVFSVVSWGREWGGRGSLVGGGVKIADFEVVVVVAEGACVDGGEEGSEGEDGMHFDLWFRLVVLGDWLYGCWVWSLKMQECCRCDDAGC